MCEGVYSADQFCNNIQIGVQLLGLLVLADCRRLRVIRCQLTTLPVNIMQLHEERINLLLVIVLDKAVIPTFYL